MASCTLEALAAYCDRYGYIFQGSGIYGGLANTWDYGPLGSKLKNNIKDAWRYYFLQLRDDSFELDSNILMNPRVWEASGHVEGFNDPMVDCRGCNARYRADSLIGDHDPACGAGSMSVEDMDRYIQDNALSCPKCGKRDFTPVRQFNLMLETRRGVTGDRGGAVYLRPENAQGEYVNYLNVVRTMRAKPPFGIGQIGKAFRNEVTPRNFTFRTIEFEQMEYQAFCRAGQDGPLYEHFKEYAMSFFRFLGLPAERLRFHDHEKLAHYARAACDVEYEFPFGWGEINGTHNRADFDLRRHQEYAGKTFTLYDGESGERYFPFVIESTCGLDRLVLAVLWDALAEEALPGGGVRQVLRLKPMLAPYKALVLPLVKKRHGEKARQLFETLRTRCPVLYDDAGNIGRRYRRGDAAGVPFAVTVDDSALERNAVTLRERDSMEQITLPVEELPSWLEKRVNMEAV